MCSTYSLFVQFLERLSLTKNLGELQTPNPTLPSPPGFYESASHSFIFFAYFFFQIILFYCKLFTEFIFRYGDHLREIFKNFRSHCKGYK